LNVTSKVLQYAGLIPLEGNSHKKEKEENTIKGLTTKPNHPPKENKP